MSAVLLLLGVTSCGEVKRNYKTYRDAENAGVIAKNSFLPECIPQSARNIAIIYDHDLDKGRGSFHFDKADAQQFLECIKYAAPVQATGLEGMGIESVTVGRHVMRIDWGSCSVELAIVRGD